jgi:mannose-6-phosphate isomerase-like protein (cupin superfamily)
MTYVNNLEKDTLENDNFRKVLNTTDKSQLVVMSLLPEEDIGEEVHNVDQFIRIEQGTGKAFLDGEGFDIEDDFGIVIPAGTTHNIINTGDIDMKLYTIYTPPEHEDGTIHETKADATEAEGKEKEEEEEEETEEIE